MGFQWNNAQQTLQQKKYQLPLPKKEEWTHNSTIQMSDTICYNHPLFVASVGSYELCFLLKASCHYTTTMVKIIKSDKKIHKPNKIVHNDREEDMMQ